MKLSKKMQRLLARGAIHFVTDPNLEAGGGGGGGDDEAAAAVAAAAAAKAIADAAAAADEEEGEDDKSGGEKLSTTERELLAESMGRKAKIKQLNADLDALKAQAAQKDTQLAKFTSTLGDIDLAEVATLISDKKAAATKALEDRGEYDRILEQIRVKNEETTAELVAKVTTLTAEKSSLAEIIDEMTLGRSFNESPYIRETSTLPASISRKEFSKHFELKDGELVAYDKPAGAKDRTPLVDASGKFEPFEAAIKFLYEKHPEAKTLIKSALKPGSRAKPTDGVTVTKSDDDAPKSYGLSRIQGALEAASAAKKK